MGILSIPPFAYRLSNALTEIALGDVYDVAVLKVEKSDYSKIRKIQGWRFLWVDEVKNPEREVYKLVIIGTYQIQGLISIKGSEGFYEMYVVETAPHNYGKNKKYGGVLHALVAFACKKSFEARFNGEVAFTSKSTLIEHYRQTIQARLIYPPNRMAIFSEDAYKLVSSYFKNIT